jgi:hypothetical protein
VGHVIIEGMTDKAAAGLYAIDILIPVGKGTMIYAARLVNNIEMQMGSIKKPTYRVLFFGLIAMVVIILLLDAFIKNELTGGTRCLEPLFLFL